VSEYSSTKAGSNPFGVLESAWRVANWAPVKDALSQIEVACPKDQAWKVNLYRGYLAICSSEDQNLAIVERYVDSCQTLCIREWKRLPHLVSSAHIPLLQAAQQVNNHTELFSVPFFRCFTQLYFNSVGG
jgi:transformation/transcription domain-associated protein